MACNQCFHNFVCGSASPYSDSSQCKTFVDKGSVVPIDILHKAQSECDSLRAKCRVLNEDIRTMKSTLNATEEELRYLRIIKQTLEMCSGRKFDYEEGEST